MAKKKKKGKASPKSVANRKTAQSDPAPFLIDRLSVRTTHVVGVAILIIVSIAFFGNFHFAGKSVAPSDTVGWRASSESIRSYEAETGDRALWSTNMFSGMPAYMISYPARSFQLDTVAKWLRYVIWPSSHFIFVLLGMYLLALLATDNWIASLLAAIAYGLTTYLPILILAGHNSKFIALCFAPWLVLAFVNAMKRPGLLAALLFAAAAAINLRAGHVQITYFYVIGVFVMWVGAGIAAQRNGTLSEFARATGFLLLGSVLAVLMVAQPYMANAEYKEMSIRGGALTATAASGLGWENAMAWSQGRAELLTLLIADSFGGAALYWGDKSMTAGPHYVGGIVFFLALVALVRRRDWLVISSAVAFLLMVGFSLGDNLSILNRPAYNLLPLFSSFRAPETWLAAAAFFVALLAAIGLGEIVKVAKSGVKLDRSIIGPWLGVTILVVLLLVGKSTLFSFEKTGERDRFAAQIANREQVQADDVRVRQAVDQFVAGLQQDRLEAFEKDAMRTFVLLLLAGGFLYAATRNRRLSSLAALGVVLLVLFDLFGVGRRYLSEDVMVDSKDITEQIPRYDFDDYLLEQVQESGGPGHFRVLSLEGDPSTTARPSYYYQSVTGYHGAKLRVYQEYLDNVLFADGRLNPGAAFDLLNIRYVVAGQPIPGFTRAYSSEQTGLTVFRNNNDPGRAFFVDHITTTKPGAPTWDAIRSPAFDPAREAILHLDPSSDLPGRVAVTDSAATGSVSLTSYGPRQITWDVQTSVDRFLVVSEIYYPKGWHAAIDGTQSTIYQTNGALRGVVIPAGQHELTMRFDPASDRIGGIVAGTTSALVYVGIIGLLLAAYRRRQRSVQHVPNEPA